MSEKIASFSIDSGFKEIEVYNTKKELITVLRINVADANTAERFAHLIDNLDGISNKVQEEAKRLEAEYGPEENSEDQGDIDIDTKKIIAVNRFKVEYIMKCVDELNSVFGENTIQNVYRECYEDREDFVPDESLLLQFVEKSIPVMNELFHKRFEANRKKYNSMRRGKHNKSKRELIQGYGGLNG